MPSKQHAEIQGNWMERLAFQRNTAGTTKCENYVLVSERQTIWYMGKGTSSAVIPSMNLLQFFSPYHELLGQAILYSLSKPQLLTVTDTKTVFNHLYS